ncbi:MAG: hypothetical protein AAF518_15030 [Spirochaetota bacterium]
MKKILLLGIALLFSGTLFAKQKVLYVTSPSAKLMKTASFGSGTALRRGDKLTVLGKSGMFYKVRVNGKSGYVSKMFASSKRPGSKVSLRSGKSSRGSSARRRASSYSETASARGLTSSEKIRVRGNAGEYDYTAVQWMESQSEKIKQADLESFESSSN